MRGTIFISGGAGFIGSHLLAKLLQTDGVNRVIVYDNFSSGTRRHLAGVSGDSRLNVVEADLKDLTGLTQAMQGADLVFHLAANPDISKAVTQPTIDFWEGTYLAQNLLEAMRVNAVRRLVYFSGSGIYGENPSVAFSENHGPCKPISTYGASKLACEALVSAYCHMFGLTACAFRFANVVGPRQTHGVGYDFLRQLKSNPARLRILGDGSQSKSYIHVDDVLSAVFLAEAKLTEGFEVFNVATDDYITVRQIADLAAEVCGVDRSQLQYDFTGGDRGWKGDVPIVRFDCAKIKGLGWSRRDSAAQAMRHALESMWRELSDG